MESAVFVASDYGEEAFGFGQVGRFEFFARHVFGVEIGAFGFSFRYVEEEGLVIVEIGPGAFVEAEVIETRAAEF